MSSKQLREFTATAALGIALCVISWLAFHGHESATGALIAVVSAGVGYLFRGRVEEPR